MKYLRDTSGVGEKNSSLWEEEEQLKPKWLIVCEHQKIQSITTLAQLASMATDTSRQIWHPKIKLHNRFYHKQKWEGERLKASLVTVVVLAVLAASMWPPASCLVSLASAASCLVFGDGGGLVAVVAKASVVVTFFFRCSHATCRFVVSCSSSSHSEESSSPSEQIPSFLQD